MGRYAGVERARLFQAQESGEGFGRDAAAPEGAVDPVADLSFSVRRPTQNVPGDLAVGDDRLYQTGIVREDLLPVLIERSPIARTEGDHRYGDGVALVFEEQRQVVRFDIAQLHLWFQGIEFQSQEIRNGRGLICTP